ncbi:MAG: PH domain-containing protein [Lachnospiraceae bacterium]|nr:PH domain-containing protein [Lachnospiraceae bacterium]
MKQLWKDRKRLRLFGLPWTFTTYTLLEDKLLVDSGLFTSKQDEVRLYRVMDISMERKFSQKLFNLGSIICDTSDKSSPKLELVNIKNPKVVKELLSEAVEAERIKKRVSSREYMSYGNDDYDTDDHDDNDIDDDNE